ncbi:MAG: beta-ketoacyl-ACP synthase III [Bacteroidales bacterium]|jgi:3-oxoacyl-[acyl-carrier-protein] synthase-3|nr:beta-ketoacyl-ACP synthase III [Bacteroidales bacterium]
MINEVYITRLSKFLPNKPVDNDRMEDFLGMIDGKPSKAKRIILRNNQITQRYYALDEKGKLTHNNAQLTAAAIRLLFDKDFTAEDIELLACGTTSPDQTLPSHASMVHGELGGKPLEIISPSGSCATGMHAMKYAYLAVKAGEKNNAVCSGSELFSIMMQADKFEKETENLHLLDQNPILAFEKEFLRWMLSDGAGAALLQNSPNPDGLSLRIDWIESASFAGRLETCMYSGGEKMPDGNVKGWKEFDSQDILNKSLFSLHQDVKLLGENIYQTCNMFLADIVKRRNLDLNQIDYFLPHISSEYFRYRIDADSIEKGVHIPQEKWFTNLVRLGNVGAASIYFMLEEIFHSGILKKGQKLLLGVPESARFSYVYSLVTVV